MKREVWVLKHHNTDGDDDLYVAVFGNEFDAIREMQKYVLERWEEEMEGVDLPPGGPDRAVARYFEEKDDTEWYEIHSQNVDFLEVEIGSQDEVDFSAEEVAITHAALGMAAFTDLVDRTGLNQGLIQTCVKTAREKLDS